MEATLHHPASPADRSSRPRSCGGMAAVWGKLLGAGKRWIAYRNARQACLRRGRVVGHGLCLAFHPRTGPHLPHGGEVGGGAGAPILGPAAPLPDPPHLGGRRRDPGGEGVDCAIADETVSKGDCPGDVRSGAWGRSGQSRITTVRLIPINVWPERRYRLSQQGAASVALPPVCLALNPENFP